jgi:glycosyltransferase 2 family protein
VGVSASILAVILSRIPAETLLGRVKQGQPVYLAAALLLVLLILVLVAVRWRLLANWLGLAAPIGLAVRAVFLGAFGSQVLPSTVGADLVRGYMLLRHTAAIGRVAASVIADRLFGLFALCLLLVLFNPVLLQLPAPYAGLLAPAALLASGAVLLAFLLACTTGIKVGTNVRLLRRLRELGTIDGVRLEARPIAGSVALGLAIHALAVLIASLVARAYGVEPSLGVWVSIIPLSLLACAVPVSIGGWGVREGAIILLAGPLGVPPAEALLVSLTIGVLNVVASLPGAVVLLRWHRADVA